ncbi:ankyrin repeat protein [Elysia marginata]|uniref:Ankyrin repeat protein n=1 Tax=Elysia marginata TaxID=1093978 RepID=A0AAV4EDI9_9GAST|nr:ankyrin repeat protein [Elysia marginata]
MDTGKVSLLLLISQPVDVIPSICITLHLNFVVVSWTCILFAILACGAAYRIVSVRVILFIRGSRRMRDDGLLAVGVVVVIAVVVVVVIVVVVVVVVAAAAAAAEVVVAEILEVLQKNLTKKTYSSVDKSPRGQHIRQTQRTVLLSINSSHFILLAMDQTELLEAIGEFDIDEVKHILESGDFDINGYDSESRPPIIECVKASYTIFGVENDARACEILRLLVRYGADLNVRDGTLERHTAVIIAADQGSIKCLEVLVEAGADLSITSESGYTAVMVAASMGKADCVKYLIRHMTLSQLNLKNRLETNALLMAASSVREGGPLCTKYLIEAGVDLQVEDEKGYTALMLTIHDASCGIATLLLEKGAPVNTVSHFGETPLSVCDDRYLPKLLQRKLDLTLSRRNHRCLHRAVVFGEKDVARTLVMHGFPPIDLKMHTGFRKPLYKSTPISPLALAIDTMQPDVAKYLIRNRFFTGYDLHRLCSEPEIRQSLRDKNQGHFDEDKARQCLEILEFLSRRPQSLSDLCLVTISSALSQDFAFEVLDLPKGKEHWVCEPTFAQRVELLQLPQLFKTQLLHQTPNATISWREWKDIHLE